MHPLRRSAQAIVPHFLPARISAAILAMGDRYGQYRRYRRSDAPAAIRAIEKHLGLTVRRGPFQGMVYPRANAYSRHSIPRLLGCYEEELHQALAASIADASHRRYVDIGSGEGYYSVGFARATRRPVYAFEVDPVERRFSRLMARANGVHATLKLSSWCSPETLVELCPDRSFILCDCEGYEATLFTPAVVRSLKHSDLIVELHDLPGIDTIALIHERFSGTHDVSLIPARDRRASDYPELARLSLEEDRFVSELRNPGQQWAVITSRQPDFRPSPSSHF